MTVGITSGFSGAYTGNGATTSFPYTFKALTASEVQVLVDDVVVASGYTVTLETDGNGGTVTFASPPSSGTSVVIVSNPSFAQEISFRNAGQFLASSHDTAIDRSAIRDIAIKRDVDRSLKLPIGESASDLPAVEDRVGLLLGFDPVDGSIVATEGTPGPQGPGTDLAVQVDETAAGDGATDDTSAIQAVINAAAVAQRRVRFGAKTYGITEVTVPANVVIETAGLVTKFRQLPGTAANKRFFKVIGSNVTFGDCTLEGNYGQAGDTTDEQNHGILVQATASTGDIVNFRAGNIHGKNIRGDVLYVGSQTGSGATVLNPVWGNITFDNVQRNGVSIVGSVRGFRGGSHRKAPTATYGCGFLDLDIESDPGTGIVDGGYIHEVYGKRCFIAQTSASVYGRGIHFGTMNLDPNRDPGCNPVYTPGTVASVAPYGFIMRNTKYAKIDHFIANGFNGQAIKCAYDAGELPKQTLNIDYAEITDCCKTDVLYNSYIQGALGVSRIRIGLLVADATLANHQIMDGFQHSRVEGARITNVGTGSFAKNCEDCTFNNIAVTNGIVLNAATRCTVNGGSFNGDRVMNFCTDCEIRGLVAVASTSYDNSGTRNIFYDSTIGGTRYHIYRADNLFRVDATGVVTGISYKVGTLQLVGARKTGWAVDTGTAKRTANATYAAGATLTFSAGYVQAEMTALATRLAVVETALQNETQTMKALKDDLHATAGHGLIGT
jgi:hypothetical protein